MSARVVGVNGAGVIRRGDAVAVMTAVVEAAAAAERASG
jgi:hypothetical protein